MQMCVVSIKGSLSVLGLKPYARSSFQASQIGSIVVPFVSFYKFVYWHQQCFMTYGAVT